MHVTVPQAILQLACVYLDDIEILSYQQDAQVPHFWIEL